MGLVALFALAISAPAQPSQVPPAAIAQLQSVIGNRVELGTILGGDYAAAGGIYSFRGGSVAELSMSKLGGGGAVADPKPLGLWDFKWAPVLQGNLGRFKADNDFTSGYLEGNKSSYDTGAVLGGAGVRFYFTEHFSLAPTLSGLYGHTENEFQPANAAGNLVKATASGTYVDWTVDAWSIVPALDLRYDWRWGRTAFEFRSRYNFFHTESFDSSSPVVSVNGNSQTWENKLDADVPLGWKLFGGELHTGGFFSRTDIFGEASQGLSASYFYTANGRFVLDTLGKLWKVQWLGFGASYIWGGNFNGWSAGLDLSLKL